MLLLLYLCYFLISLNSTSSIDIDDLNVPPEHIQYVINAFPSVAESCSLNPECKYKHLLNVKACWGYELDCHKNNSYKVRPFCPGDHRGWVKTKDAQYDTFYTQADFGKHQYKLVLQLLSFEYSSLLYLKAQNNTDHNNIISRIYIIYPV